ncbi:MAG TPA: methylamine utilization protein [Steroidobacteraceae bacterium]|nr:methylamine utilization protein [Steroidobacteraceae bacterium]
MNLAQRFFAWVSFSLLLTVQASAADVTVTVGSDDPTVIGDVIVYAVPKPGSVAGAAKSTKAIVDQRDKEFVPLVSVVRVGTSVEFPNSDNIRHQVYSFSPAKVFNLKLYSGRPSSPVTFDRPGVVTLGCNIHDQMIAWVLIVDSPWYAKVGTNGSVTLKDLPAGDFTLHAWHPGINPATHMDAVQEPLHIESATVSKSLRVKAISIAKIRQEMLASGEHLAPRGVK